MKVDVLNHNLKNILSDQSMTNILINLEGIFDYLNLYTYKNFKYGEIAEEPKFLNKFNVEVVLLYPYTKMPDPSFYKRLRKHDVKVYFKEDTYEQNVEITGPESMENDPDIRGRIIPKIKVSKIWLIKFIIPTRMFKEINIDDINISDVIADGSEMLAALNLNNNDNEYFDDVKLSEGLEYGDLKTNINNVIHIDDHISKIDDESKVVVMELQVKSANIGEDLKKFIETSYIDHLDVDFNKSKVNLKGHYSVFVEFLRNKNTYTKIKDLLSDIKNIADNDNKWKFINRDMKRKDAIKFNKENFNKFVITDRKQYKKKYFKENE